MAMLLRVAHKVFTEGGVNFQDYLEKTLWSGDIGALKYLDEQHETIYGKKSIIGELYYNRRSLYKRIYTLRLNEKNNNKEQSLYNDMKNISLSIELKICTEIAKKISELVDAPAGGLDVDDVLIDIPGRRMDSGGDVFVVLGSGAVENLNNVSEPIRNINENYKHLAKRARLFASPRLVKRLRNKFGMAFTQTQQQNIYEIIKESVVQNTSKSTINWLNCITLSFIWCAVLSYQLSNPFWYTCKLAADFIAGSGVAVDLPGEFGNLSCDALSLKS